MGTMWVDFLGAEIRFRDVKGVRTRSVEMGTGEAVLLLHGGSGHAETWVKNVKPLAQNYRVFAMDMLGRGFTDKPTRPYGVLDQADHLRDFLDTVGIDAAHFVGESMGGLVAAWVALKYPERVLSVTLNTAAGLHGFAKSTNLPPDFESSYNVEGRDLSQAAFQRLNDQSQGTPTRESVRKRLEFLVYDPLIIPDEMVEVRYATYTDPDFARSRQLYSYDRDGLDLTPERLNSIKCPVYFLWTRQNSISPWQVAEAAHKALPGSRLTIMEEAGHWPQFEKPDEYNELTLDFLKSASRTIARAK